MSAQELLEASRCGDLSKVKELLKLEVSLEFCDKHGNNSLSRAARNGYPEIVECLLQAKANPELKNSCGRTPLALAAFRGQYKTVQVLLQFKAELEVRDYRHARTPLALVVNTLNGYIKTVRCLIEAGAELESRDKYGHTPLISAVSNYNYRFAQTLVDAGAWIYACSTKNETLESLSFGDEKMRKILATSNQIWLPEFHRLSSESIRQTVMTIMTIWTVLRDTLFGTLPREVLFLLFNLLF